MPRPITTKDNHFQRLEVLRRNRKKRFEYRQLFVEGVKNVNALLSSEFEIEALYYPLGSLLSSWAREVLNRYPDNLIYGMDQDLFNELSGKDEPPEIFVVAKQPEDSPMRIKITENPLIVIFDRPQNPGNLGTIIRTMDALGADGLIVTGHAVDLYDSQTIQASVGSIFHLPVIRSESLSKIMPWITKIRTQYPETCVVGTSAHAKFPYYKHDFTKPTILLLGNEARGLSQAFLEFSDTLVTIPMKGSATSLNVSCAAAMLIGEVMRVRSEMGLATERLY